MPTPKRGNIPRWSDVKFETYRLKLLNVSKIKGRKDRWPEVVMLEVPDSAKKKLQSRTTLRDFLNASGVFSKPTRKIERSLVLPARRRPRWILIVFHGRTSTSIVVWAPAS
ncbi:MAG TPA: hypothetical protein VFB28_13210 [Terriglobales bacterium]|jgi:hypothetical protein|nr:hypothetical protein [Terriglobales bacterium]